MTFPERSDVVLGRSRSDFGSAWFLLLARGMPLGDGVKDDLGRERSHLSKLRVMNHLSLNPLPLRLQVVLCLLQLSDQPIRLSCRGRRLLSATELLQKHLRTVRSKSKSSTRLRYSFNGLLAGGHRHAAELSGVSGVYSQYAVLILGAY